MLSSTIALLALTVASPAVAQLAQMRGTIPGALHQCEDTSMVFFQTGGERPLDVLFLPSADVPNSLRSGTTTLEEAQQVGPLQAIPGLTAADNDAAPLQIQLAAGQVFEVFGFLPDGSGKALSLTRTVMTPLPGATNCLTDVQTRIGAAAAATTTSAPRTRTRSSAQASSAASSGSVASSSELSSSATQTSATPSASNANQSQRPTSGAVHGQQIGWALGLGGVGALLEMFIF